MTWTWQNSLKKSKNEYSFFIRATFLTILKLNFEIWAVQKFWIPVERAWKNHLENPSGKIKSMPWAQERCRIPRCGAKECTFCRSPKSLKNEPRLAIVAVHTAENESLKVLLFIFMQSTSYCSRCSALVVWEAPFSSIRKSYPLVIKNAFCRLCFLLCMNQHQTAVFRITT